MPQVQVIQPIQQQPKRLRVAAYARVSSDSEDQLNSLSVQVDYYTHLIQENPNWDFAGIYADEGITGTSTKHREQFNRLLDDCRAGLIDRVLVKSASRFARNTADALASVREMKSLGVTISSRTATAVTGSMSFTKGEQNNDHHKRRTGIAGYAAQGNAGEKKPYADYADCWGTSGRDYRV